MENETLRMLSVALALFSFGYTIFNLTKGVPIRTMLRFLTAAAVMLILLQVLAILLNFLGHPYL